MKRSALPLLFSVLFLVSFALAPLSARAIKVGDRLETILEALGKPAGSIELRDKTLLLYPFGEITLKDERAVEVDLMTEEEFAEDQARLAREREEWLVQQEKLAEARKAEGEAIRKDKMKSGAFAALPAKDKVDYWRSFQIRYPEVDVSEQIAAALESYETELTELRSQQRIAELEARVAAAEREAAAARLETEKLRRETQGIGDRRYGLRYYTDPVIRPNYHYKPPTVTIYSDGKVTTVPSQQAPKTKEPVNRYHFSTQHRRVPQAETLTERVDRILDEVRD